MATFQFVDDCADSSAELAAPVIAEPEWTPRLPQPYPGDSGVNYRGFLDEGTTSQLATLAGSGAALEHLARGAPETARGPGIGGVLLLLAALYAIS